MPTEFDLPAHDDFVQRHSESVTYYRASKCNCGNQPDATRANVNCLVCGGIGLLYAAPADLTGMVVGIQSQRSWIEAGLADHGDLVLSLKPFESVRVRDWDKVTLSGWNDGDLYPGEVLRRGTGVSDTLKYVPVALRRVFQTNPTSGVVTDFTAASYALSGRTLTWANEPKPAPGTGYTVEYDPRFEWLAFLPTVQRREQADNLGQRVLLRRKHSVVPWA